MALKSLVKGWLGETVGAVANWVYLPTDAYRTLNNVTLPTSNGTTQIDHVVVSRHGIFVIEAKNMDGWIFGDERSPQWTQMLNGRKYRFQNPLHQNYRHTKALAGFLGIDHDKLHSVVMFWGETEFKTPMPPNVMKSGYVTYIKSRQDVLFTDEEVEQLVEALKTGRLPRTWATRQMHVQSLQTRHASTTTCPKCGAALVERTVSKGERAGQRFLGCSAFPKCRFTRESGKGDA